MSMKKILSAFAFTLVAAGAFAQQDPGMLNTSITR